MQGKILVTTEVLRTTASEFESAMTQIQNYTSMMMDGVNGLSGKFEGEAATLYISKFNQHQEDINKLAKMVNEHVADLNEMAANYDAGESKNIDEVQALPGNVL